MITETNKIGPPGGTIYYYIGCFRFLDNKDHIEPLNFVCRQTIILGEKNQIFKNFF